MFERTRRYLLVIGLLLVAVALTWGQRLLAAARTEPLPPEPVAEVSREDAPALDHTYFVDTEGWYRITPYETVVRSAVDLTAESTEAMAEALPDTLGEWQQVGEDKYVGDDPAVVFYLNHPTVALQRVYVDDAGQKVTLAIIGNRGEDSFLLFSHTPETCYPGRLWNVVDSRQESAVLETGPEAQDSGIEPMYAQYLLTEHGPSGEQLMVLYWYLWDDPERKSDEGVLSMRVNLYLPEGATEQEVLDRAWDFVRELFPATLPWERF